MGTVKNLADSNLSISPAAMMRRRRFRRFLDLVESCPKRRLRILDVGGTENFWEMMNFVDSGHEITVLNLTQAETRHKNIIGVAGDACSMPQFNDDQFDIVFSNSVIEHVGSWENQQRMADEVRRLAKKYFVQTPNYYFPMEPHSLFPGFQFLPVAMQVWLVQRRAIGWFPQAENYRQACEIVGEIHLLKKREMKTLFPDAVILHERFLGATKSLMAVRR